MPYGLARATSVRSPAMRFSQSAPNSGNAWSFASVRSTVWIQTPFTPAAASRCSRPSGIELTSGSISGSP